MGRVLFGLALASSLLSAQDSGLGARAVKVLEQRCWGCHGPSLAQSGLRLDSREAVLKGGTRGPAIVAGNAAQSRMVQAIRRTGEPHMPPGPKLPDSEIALIERVDAGARGRRPRLRQLRRLRRGGRSGSRCARRCRR